MNALINCDKIYCEYAAVKPRREKTYFGDILAAAIVVFFATASLVISGWSVFTYLTSRPGSGIPLAELFFFLNSLANLT